MLNKLLHRFTKTVVLCVGVAVLSLVLSIGIKVIMAAWQPPSGSPPTGDISAPINVSNVAQIKAGGLTIGTNTTAGIFKVFTAGDAYFECTTCVGTTDLVDDAVTKVKMANNTVGKNELDSGECADNQIWKKSAGAWGCGIDATGITGSGSKFHIPLWTDTNLIGNSVMMQEIGGSNNIYIQSPYKFGIGTSPGKPLSIGASGSGLDYFYDPDQKITDYLSIYSYGAEGIRIDNQGWVAIGAHTPAYQFQVYNSTDHAQMVVQTGHNDRVARIGVETPNAKWDIRVGQDQKGGKEFDITDNGTARLTIDTSGNVGIGNRSPSAKLHVSGSSGDGLSAIYSSEADTGQSAVYGAGGNVTYGVTGYSATASTSFKTNDYSGIIGIGRGTEGYGYGVFGVNWPTKNINVQPGQHYGYGVGGCWKSFDGTYKNCSYLGGVNYAGYFQGNVSIEKNGSSYVTFDDSASTDSSSLFFDTTNNCLTASFNNGTEESLKTLVCAPVETLCQDPKVGGTCRNNSTYPECDSGYYRTMHAGCLVTQHCCVPGNVVEPKY